MTRSPDESAFWNERRHAVKSGWPTRTTVFFAARDRKQEIKEQIKQLEDGLGPPASQAAVASQKTPAA